MEAKQSKQAKEAEQAKEANQAKEGKGANQAKEVEGREGSRRCSRSINGKCLQSCFSRSVQKRKYLFL